jgi:hypothetical protein
MWVRIITTKTRIRIMLPFFLCLVFSSCSTCGSPLREGMKCSSSSDSDSYTTPICGPRSYLPRRKVICSHDDAIFSFLWLRHLLVQVFHLLRAQQLGGRKGGEINRRLVRAKIGFTPFFARSNIAFLLLSRSALARLVRVNNKELNIKDTKQVVMD